MQEFHVHDREKLKKYLWAKDTPWEYEQKLLEKVAKYSSLFRYIPWIQGICICNSLAMNACHPGSDIDLFVITRKNRLWTARIFLTLVLSILGQRKTAKQHAEKFCLSFFISEEAMNLEKIAIENDIYLKYWIETLRPILNRDRVYERFMNTNLIQFSPQGKRKSQISPPLLEERRFRGEVLCKDSWAQIPWNLLESVLKFIFFPRTKKSFQKLWKPFWVIISDTMLKFHDQDRRREIRNNIL